MTSDYIYIKLCSNDSICLSNLKIKLKNKCDEIVFDGITDNFGKLKIPICSNEVYKLVIYSNKRKEHLVTVLLKDKYYPNIKIEGGQMILWQDIQFQ